MSSRPWPFEQHDAHPGPLSRRLPLGGARVSVEPTLVVDDLEMVCEAVAAGAGLARLPSFVTANAVSDGRLQLAAPNEAAERRPVYAVWPVRRYVPAKVRAFIDAVTEQVQGDLRANP